MLTALIFFAQAAQEKADKVEGPGLITSFLPIILIGVFFYFLIILPGRRERQQRQSLISALKVNDKIVTTGGILGVVLNIKEGADEITIKSGDAKLTVLRSAIARVQTEADKESSTAVKAATRCAVILGYSIP